MQVLGRLTVLTVVVTTSAALVCGVAYAADDGYGSPGGGGRPGGSWNHGQRSYHSNVERDDAGLSRGGRGGAPGSNFEDCDMKVGPGSQPKQCATYVPSRGADGPAHLVF
ncbi:MAG: hypothetical protein M3Z25_11830 [Actinomycetota bacterium]|nr:hypothetical protein [Actinomycetota bacterium]